MCVFFIEYGPVLSLSAVFGLVSMTNVTIGSFSFTFSKHDCFCIVHPAFEIL